MRNDALLRGLGGIGNDALLRLTHPTLDFLAVFGFDRTPPLHGCALPHSGL